jgi:kynureninase
MTVLTNAEWTIEDARCRDTEDPLRRFRDQFAAATSGIYLCGNSLGRPSLATREALATAVQLDWPGGVQSWQDWVSLPRTAGDMIASLIGAAPGEVIMGDSTTVNAFKLAWAGLDANRPRRVIVTTDDNFPSNLYVLEGLLAAHPTRHELKVIRTDPSGGVTPAQLAEAVNRDTALVYLSHVAYGSGWVADMAALTRIAQDAGAFMLWDLSHSVGAMPVHLDAVGADLAVGCTYKYLNGAPGGPAFMYVRGALQAQLRQPVCGWWGQQNRFEMGRDYNPFPAIERFTSGTPDVLGCLAALHGARLINDAGIARIYTKGQALTSYAVELADTWLSEHGVRLASPRDPNQRGCHITLHHPRAWQLCQALNNRNVIVDYRNPDRLRIGCSPLYTGFTEIHEGIATIRDILRENAHLSYPIRRAPIT